ncbi:MAG: ABC transporter permease, partial [Alphaproteobacteria bacterium]
MIATITLLERPPSSRLGAFLHRAMAVGFALVRNPLAAAGLAILFLLVLVAAIAPLLAPFPPYAQDLATRLLAPSAVHWLGTDELGRDILSRILFGARVTLEIVALVAVIAAPVGLLIGTTAGYLGGIADTVLMRVTDAFLAFPKLVLALALVAALGPGLDNAIIAISVASWPAYARIARAETLAVRGA